MEEVSGSSCCCGAASSDWKQSGKVVARLRLARKPKLRIRTKPLGSRCNRKRRKKSSRGRVNRIHFGVSKAKARETGKPEKCSERLPSLRFLPGPVRWW